jgi:chaperone BCS1
MTTNAREMLDDALTRPGRVDPQIGFTLATRDQIRDIYMRMFSATTAIADNTSAPPAIMTGQVPPQALKKHKFLGIRLPEKSIAATVEPGKLTEMAQRFADALPKKIFSPAEFQGYLLMHKMEPEKAIEVVRKWNEEMFEAKKKGKEVVGQ